MSDAFLEHLRGTLAQIEADGLTKRERLIDGPQGGRIRVAGPTGRARWSISAPTTTSASPIIPR